VGAGEEERGKRAGGRAALAFALLALGASWNPMAAPFGLLVGVGAVILSLRARRGVPSRRATLALALAALATVASAAVLLLGAGAMSVELTGEPVVKGRSAAELDEVLSAAAARTAAARGRAEGELDRLSGRADGGGALETPVGPADAGRPGEDEP